MTSMHLQSSRIFRLFQLCLLCSILWVAACAPVEQSQWTAAQEASEGQQATDQAAVAGGEFNKFFPEARDEFDVVYTQEKQGFAEAILRDGDDDVATLAVFDTISNPDAAAKYADSTEEVASYPAIAIGSNGTGILVADRFQVQVRSTSDNFTADDRATWLAAFDLDGLAGLE